jgi:hypothetical protein
MALVHRRKSAYAGINKYVSQNQSENSEVTG